MQGLNLRSKIPDFVDGLMQSRHAIVHLHRQSELLFQRLFLSLSAWVDEEMQRNRLRFAADGQFHLIITRQGQRSPRADAKVKRAGYLYGIIVTQVPGEPVHSFVWWNRLRALDAIRPLRRLLAFFFLFA